MRSSDYRFNHKELEMLIAMAAAQDANTYNDSLSGLKVKALIAKCKAMLADRDATYSVER